MPQIGNDSNRVKIRNNQNNRIFGDTGSWYKAENKTTSETTQAK